MRYLIALVATVVCSLHTVFAQESYPNTNGIPDKRAELYAFTNATLFTDHLTKIEGATLIIEKGKVKASGKGIAIPKEAIVIDLNGKFIYPSFVDPYTSYGMGELERANQSGGYRDQFLTDKKGAYHWNQAIKPETQAKMIFSADAKSAADWRKLGFGAVSTHQMDGVARGTSAFVSLADASDLELVLKADLAAHFSFSKGVSTQNNPSSLMGYIALIRQTYYDAAWYKMQGAGKETNLSLEAWNQHASLPQIFDVRDKLEILRADKLGDEFGVQYIMKGNGDEYQRINEIKATNASIILTVNYPDAYDVQDPLDADMVSFTELKHWEMAPYNATALSQASIPFAFTTHGLKDKSLFLKNIRKSVNEYGLKKEDALKALTLAPAQLLKVDNLVGSLQPGRLANFLVVSGDLFDEKSVIYENWVQGKKSVLQAMDLPDLRGDYSLTVGDSTYKLKVTGTPESQSFEIVVSDSVKHKVTLTAEKSGLVSLSFDRKKTNPKGQVRLSGWRAGKDMQGSGVAENGSMVAWAAKFEKEFTPEASKEEKKEEKAAFVPSALMYPFSPFGWTERPTAKTVLIKNATVWTNEKEGILENTDVLIKGGKIVKVGKKLSESGVDKVIDGTGKHVTSGIIDEHSHIGISRGVNEGSQAVSAEVNIEDVIDSEDVDIYRTLAGGVTAAQLLHGSANPVGGQSALVKWRWGLAPEQLKIEGADKYIKFALGENVKHSNWGSYGYERYPQTRMGVEQVYVDVFTRAREYEKAKAANPTGTRKDLELDVILEILNKKRFITCHSYVQSEINMLMKVADKFNFKVNTFTHILEGYKVADKMKAHGVGASTFSDWWAYKWEVKDAIPYNAALMAQVGLTVAINSDDAEMGRRLNQEAAKAVKYGNASKEEAWKMVTLNPAKLLHLDKRTGSLKEGKDADLVLWSNDPLSVYAKAEYTIVDGVIYFDREQDAKMKEMMQAERNRLIQKMLEAKAGGGATQKPSGKRSRNWHCEDEGEE